MTITPRIQRAINFFRAAHNSINQKRKYSGLPYFVHTEEVADIVSTVTDDEDIIIAALGHDTLEDVNIHPYDLQGIKERFGDRVASLIVELTDVYTKENYPNKNRAERKALEAARLGKISIDAQNIKLSDFVSNTADITHNDPSFAKTYLQEKRAILSVMDKGHPVLFGRASAQVK